MKVKWLLWLLGETDGAAQALRVWSWIQWATSAPCTWWILAKTSLIHQHSGRCVVLGYAFWWCQWFFVLLKNSGVCLQGACEMAVTISAESPPSSYQFFVLEWPERPVECPTSDISKQILLAGSQYSWYGGKTYSKSIGGIFVSSLWVKGLILIMRRYGCVGQGPFSSQPPVRSQVRDDRVCWAPSLSYLLSVYGRWGGSVEGLGGGEPPALPAWAHSEQRGGQGCGDAQQGPVVGAVRRNWLLGWLLSCFFPSRAGDEWISAPPTKQQCVLIWFRA